MIRTVNGIVLLILHLTVCILIWAGIRSGMLKVKKYLIIPVIFVPVWGALSMLILHLQVFSKAENSRQIGVEKLQVNEVIYKNNFRSVEENDHDIVPLEEALLINDPEKRRKLIMDILNDDPSKYIELLEKARMNEDVEVVHYAITAMVELSKDYDSKLLNARMQLHRRIRLYWMSIVILWKNICSRDCLKNRWNICREISTHSFFRRRSKQI